MSIKLPENTEKELREYLTNHAKNSDEISEIVAAEKLSFSSLSTHHVQVNMKDGRKLYFKATFEITRTPTADGYDESKKCIGIEPYTDGVERKKPKPRPLKPRKPKIAPEVQPPKHDPSIFGFNF
jgi:hypothetical protein